MSIVSTRQSGTSQPDHRDNPRGRRSRHTVRPRAVWVALALAVSGTATLGLAVATTSWWLTAVGLVVLAGGVALGWWGGALYDVHTGSASRDLEQVQRGEIHEGVAPGDMIRDPGVRAHAAAVERKRRRVLQRDQSAPRPPLAALGAISAMVVAVVVAVTEWSLNTPGRTGHGSGMWALALCAVTFLSAMRVLGPPGRRPIAGSAMLGAGVVLGLGALSTNQSDAATSVYVIGGAAVSICALTCLLSPSPDAPATLNTKKPAHAAPLSGRRRQPGGGSPRDATTQASETTTRPDHTTNQGGRAMSPIVAITIIAILIVAAIAWRQWGPPRSGNGEERGRGRR